MDEKKSGEGKFRSLIRFRADAGDTALQNHLSDFKKNATYLSPRIQNEIISICGDIAIRKVVENVKKVIKYLIGGEIWVNI